MDDNEKFAERFAFCLGLSLACLIVAILYLIWLYVY